MNVGIPLYINTTFLNQGNNMGQGLKRTMQQTKHICSSLAPGPSSTLTAIKQLSTPMITLNVFVNYHVRFKNM